MIISAQKNLEVDPIVYTILKNVNSRYPMVPVTRVNNYEFNEDLLNIRGKWILVDMCEMDWNFDWERYSAIFGGNINEFSDKFPGEEWNKFNEWVKSNHPSIYLKREIHKNDIGHNIHPIEYPNWYEVPTAQTKEQFNARPLEVFFNWGYSSEHRRRFHGEAFTQAPKYGYMVCDNLYHFDGFMANESNPKKWVVIHQPHYARVDINNLFGLSGMSKFTVSMPGAGVKCFRSVEAPLNSIVCLPEDDLAWTYPWIHGENCIRLKVGEEIKGITDALQRDDLYEIYLRGLETVEKYKMSNYAKNYLEPLINNA